MPPDLAVLHIEPGPQTEALELRATFTTMTRAGPETWRRRQAALLVVDDEDGSFIDEIGVVARSHQRVATGWHRLRYTRESEIEPVRVDDLPSTQPPRMQRRMAERLAADGVLPPATSRATVKALEHLRPDAARLLRKLLAQDRPTAPPLRGVALQAAAHEADAVRLAADLAGIPREALGRVGPDGEVSYVERLGELRVAEDPAVAFDSLRFLDFDRIESPSGVVRFASGQERLTVINVNRQPLEKTTGADLIYINETRGSFVLVQYKAFRREGESPSRLVYRPSADARLASELDRMRAIEIAVDDGSPAAFRLHPGCCFMKLCKPVVGLNHSPRELIGGMYLPIEFYDALERSGEARGPRGGFVLSYETVSRHISNDLFVKLVRGGWIGSRGATTDRLTEIVLSGLRADRSVTVAAASRGAELIHEVP